MRGATMSPTNAPLSSARHGSAPAPRAAAEMISADCLVLLSDVAGMYNGDPGESDSAELIPVVEQITPELEALAGESKTAFGSGGMVTKLAAARICMSAGCATVIASGKHLKPLARITAGEPCTWFIPERSPLAARKQWIAGALKPRGKLIVDQGAEAALAQGNSLLPVGVVGVAGEFERGDPVTLVALDGRDVGRGLAAFSSADARKVIGQKSNDLEKILGYAGRSEIVHRDNLVLFKNKQKD